MKFPAYRSSARPGTTLIELLIFIAILAIAAAAILPLLFASTENRLLQQTVSLVEQNGSQMLQTIEYRIHHAERILDPLQHATGAVLALQTASGSENPTIIGISSGALVMVRHTAEETLSSSQVAVQNFVVRDTSVSATHQSVYVRFRVTRAIRLQLPHSYSKVFEAVVTLFPADEPTGGSCGCAVPGCSASGTYVWQVCESNACLGAGTVMDCR